MANCTYTIRRPGNVAWAEGIETLVDAAVELHRAQRHAQGHRLFAEWGNGETTEVARCDIEDALREAEAIRLAADYPL